MQFLIDANLPRSLVGMLRAAGHDAQHVHDFELDKAADESIAAFAASRDLVILTTDFDFADVRNYPPRQYHGIVVIALPRRRNSALIRRLVAEFLEKLPDIGDIHGKLVVVDGGRIRVRT